VWFGLALRAYHSACLECDGMSWNGQDAACGFPKCAGI
jgi:ribosomal protein L37E